MPTPGPSLGPTPAPRLGPTAQPTLAIVESGIDDLTPRPSPRPSPRPTPRPSPRPTPLPTAADADCADSTSWYYKKSKNTCESYVAKDAGGLCKKEDKDGVDGFAACQLTCDTCPDVCEDSTTWRMYGKDYDCTYAGQNPDVLCGMTSEDGIDGYEACCVSCPPAEEACEDDANWYFKKTAYNCAWAAESAKSRCKKVDAGGVVGFDGCPVTCDNCPVECDGDDADWFAAGNEKKSCANWVAEDPASRCKKTSTLNIDGFTACCETCAL